MAIFGTDEPLWYNVGIWGELGYGVPNFGNDYDTLNNSVAYLVDAMGRNLSAVMHHADADLRTPPSINTLMRVHKLILRARSILSSRAIAPNQMRMEAQHATPAKEDFLVFPIPYFKVRNRWLKEWAGLILSALSECTQHTENRIEYDISTTFAGLVGQYLQRILVRMATELLGVARADAEKPDFVIADTVFQTYDPAKFFTSTELIDTNRPSWVIPTEDDLELLTNGIPASKLVGLQRYPRADPVPIVAGGSAGGGTVTSSTVVSTSASGSFAAPPGP
ncbi:MAG: hypothetical protein AB7F89_14200 [Pirellulaceae bacterium]